MSRQEIEKTIARLSAAGTAYALATVVRTEAPTSAKAGDRAVLDRNGLIAGWVGGGCAQPAVTRNAAAAIADGQTRLIRISRDLEGLDAGIMGYPMTCQSGGTLDIFIEPVMPKPQLVIVGKTAIAKSLCALAAHSGYDVTVAAPGGCRDEFAAAQEWIEDLDEVSGLDPAPAAVVVATQGSGDALGLEAAIASRASYIGFIASPKKSARVKQTLHKRGLDAASIENIDGPAGLFIGAETPDEIAISVLAEMVQRRRLSDKDAESDDDERASAR
jgi:xanthine dehydrogenase accessory factor